MFCYELLSFITIWFSVLWTFCTDVGCSCEKFAIKCILNDGICFEKEIPMIIFMNYWQTWCGKIWASHLIQNVTVMLELCVLIKMVFCPLISNSSYFRLIFLYLDSWILLFILSMLPMLLYISFYLLWIETILQYINTCILWIRNQKLIHDWWSQYFCDSMKNKDIPTTETLLFPTQWISNKCIHFVNIYVE